MGGPLFKRSKQVTSSVLGFIRGEFYFHTEAISVFLDYHFTTQILLQDFCAIRVKMRTMGSSCLSHRCQSAE